MNPAWIGAATLAGGLSGLAVPWLLQRLPDPQPEIPWVPGIPHGTLADRTGLGVRCGGIGALSSVVLASSLQAPWPLMLWLSLVPFGILLAVVDWHTTKLPRRVVLPLTAYALALMTLVELSVGDPSRLGRAVAGMVIARSFLWVLWWVRSAGMGFGDVRLAALLGLLLAHVSVAAAVVGMYAGFVLFAVPVLVMALIRRDRQVLRTAYPFGPFLIAGALAGVALGGPLWSSLAGG